MEYIEGCYDVKIIFIGESGTGKTSLIRRLNKDEFDPYEVTTVGIDFNILSFRNNRDETFRLRVWDTSGQERFRAITPSYIRGAAIVVMLYSVQDRKSFESVRLWHELVQQHAAQSSKILVGNKVDESDKSRFVTTEEAILLQQELGYDICLETSAKTNANITHLRSALQHFAEISPMRALSKQPSWKSAPPDLPRNPNATHKIPKDGCC